mmetsp:Transcript_11557/g.48557  ORF Transcript_11557/g.48557 Transcript_11557/m.48557 type:complete len:446 (+) Transcript_11557:381-1718(+)
MLSSPPSRTALLPPPVAEPLLGCTRQRVHTTKRLPHGTSCAMEPSSYTSAPSSSYARCTLVTRVAFSPTTFLIARSTVRRRAPLVSIARAVSGVSGSLPSSESSCSKCASSNVSSALSSRFQRDHRTSNSLKWSLYLVTAGPANAAAKKVESAAWLSLARMSTARGAHRTGLSSLGRMVITLPRRSRDRRSAAATAALERALCASASLASPSSPAPSAAPSVPDSSPKLTSNCADIARSTAPIACFTPRTSSARRCAGFEAARPSAAAPAAAAPPIAACARPRPRRPRLSRDSRSSRRFLAAAVCSFDHAFLRMRNARRGGSLLPTKPISMSMASARAFATTSRTPATLGAHPPGKSLALKRSTERTDASRTSISTRSSSVHISGSPMDNARALRTAVAKSSGSVWMHKTLFVATTLQPRHGRRRLTRTTASCTPHLRITSISAA